MQSPLKLRHRICILASNAGCSVRANDFVVIDNLKYACFFSPQVRFYRLHAHYMIANTLYIY